MRLTAALFAGHSTGLVMNQDSPRRSRLKPEPGVVPATSSVLMLAASGPKTLRRASCEACSIFQSRSK